MTEKTAMTPSIKTSNLSKPEKVACPKCDASLMFYRKKSRERPVRQIAAWLGKLGLEQYAKLFSDNDIDVAVLPDLSDQDLKDLGVSLGHRRKIFAAINKGIASVQPLAEAERPEEPTIQDAPERRYVTVLFSDLVGSTPLSTRLDPEDLRDVIAVYQRCVEETIRRFNGFVAKFMGDGVLVYFGYPEAHEDDPEQAVRAGLEIVAAVKGLQTPEPLEARVGIATGLVVVGDLIGSGASQEQAMVGKTPNLAARLQGIAAPSMVVIADSTRKLLGNLFEFEDLRQFSVKNVILSHIAVSEDIVTEVLRVAEARTMSQHQPGMRTQHGNVVGYGAGVGRTGANVNHSGASIAGLDEMKSRHLRHAPRDNARRSSAYASIARDNIARFDEGVDAGVAQGHVVAAQAAEGIDIELVVREDHKVLEVLRIGAGVVEQPVQRIVDARSTEQRKRLGCAGMPP